MMLQKINDQIRLFPAIYSQVPNKQAEWNSPTLRSLIQHSSPRRLAGEKKSNSCNHKTKIWVSHEHYLNPEFHKILSGAF